MCVCVRERECVYVCVCVRQECVCVLGQRVFFLGSSFPFFIWKQTNKYKKRIQRVCSVRKTKLGFLFSCLSFFPLFISKHTEEREQSGELNEVFIFGLFPPSLKFETSIHIFYLKERARSKE